MLDSELKRAVRSQNFLTLVVVEASREWEGMTVTADDGTVQEVAQIIGREVRDTDLLGHTDKRHARARPARRRLRALRRASSTAWSSRIENYEFPTPLRIAVGAACYPTHAVDADSLKRQALSRPDRELARQSSTRPPIRTEEHAMKHTTRSSRLSPRRSSLAVCTLAPLPAKDKATTRSRRRSRPR